MKKIIFLVFLFTTSGMCSDFASVKNEYISEVSKFEKVKSKAEKQTYFNKAKEHAKELLGIVPNVKFSIYKYIEIFCENVNKKIKELEKNRSSDDKKISLKASRDIENYIEISKFLKVGGKLLDYLYSSNNILDKIIDKDPLSIPYLAAEITTVLHVIEIIITSPDNLEDPIKIMKRFAFSSEDGTHILSVIFSVAMNNPDNADFQKIIETIDFSDKNLCKYLKIR